LISACVCVGGGSNYSLRVSGSNFPIGHLPKRVVFVDILRQLFEDRDPKAAMTTLQFTLCVAIVMTVTNGVHKSVLSALPLVQKLSKDHDLVLKTFRLLIADLCQQFSGGHPGYVKYEVSIVSFAIRRLIVI
jgi:hypothetical protein